MCKKFAYTYVEAFFDYLEIEYYVQWMKKEDEIGGEGTKVQVGACNV